MEPKQIKSLPPKNGPKEIDPDQGSLDLHVVKITEVQEVGMGVLNDGTPFLTQRGLARLCGVQNAHIGTISSEWDEEIQKPRVTRIKELLQARGVTLEKPHLEVKYGNRLLFAYPDTLCLAVIEYYAFEAGANVKTEALRNFRLLAGKALHDFIYAQVGYDPNNQVPIAWRQFHDRVALTYNAVPIGYFSVFKEIADIVVTLGQAGLHIDASFIPDISIGQAWSKFWVDQGFEFRYAPRVRYPHNYPDYFPQSASNPQPSWCYPEIALGAFRKWLRENYIGGGQFESYLIGKAKRLELSTSFVQLAITAYSDKDEDVS